MPSVWDILESKKVVVTCSRCRTRFSGRNDNCPNCGASWSEIDVFQHIDTNETTKYSEAVRRDGTEAREI